MRIHISSQREIEKEHGRRRAVYKKVEDTVLDTLSYQGRMWPCRHSAYGRRKYW